MKRKLKKKLININQYLQESKNSMATGNGVSNVLFSHVNNNQAVHTTNERENEIMQIKQHMNLSALDEVLIRAKFICEDKINASNIEER